MSAEVVEVERLLTEKELAVRWGFHPGHVARLRAESELSGDTIKFPRFIRLGRSIRYRYADIIEHEERNAS